MMNSKFQKAKRSLPAAFAALFAILQAAPAVAEGVRFDMIPSLRLEEVWRSNVKSTTQNEISSFGTRIIPGLGLKFTAPDGVSVEMRGSYERIWFYDGDAKDAEYNTWNLRVDSTGAWRFTPNFSVQPSVYFINTVDSFRRVELLPTDDPVLPPISVTDYGNTRTQTFGGGLAVEYLVSPRFAIGLNGNYAEKRFTDNDPENPGLTNNSQVGGGIGFDYILSPLSRIGILFRASHYMFDRDPDSDTFSAGIRYGYRFSPLLTLNVVAGGSYIKKDAVNGEDDSHASPSGSLRLAYNGETFTGVLYGSASYSGSSGYGEATRQYTGGATLSQRMTQTLTGILGGYYQRSKSVFTEDAIDIDTWHGSAAVRFQPWEKIYLYVNGSANRQESSGLLGQSIDNYSVSLGIAASDTFNIF